MERISLIAFMCLLLVASGAAARTWIVERDGTGDAPTIQAGIDSASAGDTVMVMAGNYWAHDISIKSGIYLTSETGTADCVTIDGFRESGVFNCFYVDSTTSVVGFNVVLGVATTPGGGMLCHDSYLKVTNCNFSYNQSYSHGGGIAIFGGAPVFTGCIVSYNQMIGDDIAGWRGGGAFSSGASPSFFDCVFSGNDALAGWHGGGFSAEYGSTPTFEGCLFVGNHAKAWGGGMCLLEDCFAELNGCTFVENEASGGDTDVGGGIHCHSSSSATLSNCIIAFSTNGQAFYWDGTVSEPVLTCCDLYGNNDGDWVGAIADQYGVNGNISEDPLFCDPQAGDFYLCSISPCLDAGACGTIGAYGFGGCTPNLIWTGVATDILGDTGAGAGFAWVDYDNDDDLDIFVTNRGDENKLFRNDSLTAGGFADATPPVLADPANSRGCAWGDYDNDGDLDLYVSNNGANKLLRNDGNGDFVDVTASPLDDPGIGQTVSWADYDNDGDVDLYVVNNGANKLFRNEGGGVFTDVTTGALGDSGSGRGMGWADYDDDGDVDLYVANYDGANVLLENQGGGVFVDATTPVLEIPAASYGVAWGDYDNDGDLDLYVSNEGTNNLLRNDGGAFVDVTASPLDDALNGRSAAWGDYDLDGDLDLYVVNNDGPNGLYRNDGGGSFSTETPGCGYDRIADAGEGFSAGFGDYDKDGDPDVYIVNDWKNRFCRNEADSGLHWLEVKLVGLVSNKFGQGARVRIVAGGAPQMREISGASGYASQGPLTAVFGLGSECVVDTLEIAWPSGAADTLTEVTCDQSLEVIESHVSGVSDGAEKPAVLRLYPGRPNPFNSLTAIRYDLPEAARVDLEVFDVSGRLVCKLIDRRLTAAGRYTALWNGLNASGRHVGPGLYFCRLSAGSAARIQRMVLLK